MFTFKPKLTNSVVDEEQIGCHIVRHQDSFVRKLGFLVDPLKRQETLCSKFHS